VNGILVFGFECAAEILGQPRAPLALRFGAEFGRCMDEGVGQQDASSDPIRPPDLLEVRRTLLEPIGAAETIAN
jgi:protein ImuB